MSEKRSFVYVSYIATTPETLWAAVTTSAITVTYFFGTSIESDWQIGSRVAYSRNGEITDHGIILACEPCRKLSFTWNHTADTGNRTEPSVVTFSLQQMDSIVKLTILHENLAEQDIVERDDTFAGLNNGWPAIISNLKSLLETGKTLPPLSLNG